MANIKGTGILQVVTMLRERRDHAEPLLAESLRPYLDNHLLVASWYPEEDFLGLLGAMTHLVPKTEAADPWGWLGRESAAVDLVQIYSSMIQKGSPWGTLQRLPRLWKLYHDSGRADVGVLGDAKAQVMVSEFAFATPEFCRWMSGYLGQMLRLAGASEVSVAPLSGGNGHGARWAASWTE
ncbi:MAG: DUF2378 family protein [Acidobacteriota bacterium]